ncbi:MAG TPA: hypothetical protein VHD14_11420 [Pseudolabrys sp.]|nr:hypothetical protein [Pseudolabrys sp.]
MLGRRSLFSRALVPSFVLCAAALLSAGAACAQPQAQAHTQTQAQDPTIKPPIRGLVSMGAYAFVPNGGQPVNTLAPLRAKSGIFGGIVVVASWQQLQPVKGGPLRPNVIDNMLAQIRVYNAHHPKKPLAVKLRVWAGFMAPEWAKQIGGAQISATHSGHLRTVGRFWSPAYRAAFANLQTLLAARYDSEPLIREVSVTQCMSFTAEPFFVPVDPSEDVLANLRKAGFNDADYKDCLQNAVSDYSAWRQTRIEFPFNPYRTRPNEGNGNAAFTIRVMRACRRAIGARCVLDNHDLNNPLGASITPIYAEMKNLKPEIEFQTLNKTPPDFPGTIRLAVSYGASSVELYQDFPKFGFPPVAPATLRLWASWLAKNTGEPPPTRDRR